MSLNRINKLKLKGFSVFHQNCNILIIMKGDKSYKKSHSTVKLLNKTKQDFSKMYFKNFIIFVACQT